MRIVTITLFASFLFVVTDPAVSPEAVENAVGQLPITKDIDPIVTGTRITAEHRIKWQAERVLYLKCPECVASQPYPGD